MKVIKLSKHSTLLAKKVDLLLQKHKFKVGDSVQWKNGLRNKKLPKEGEEAIVLEILTDPILNHETETGIPYFREPLDLVLAVLDEDNDLVIFHYDSRRFQPYVEEGLVTDSAH